MNLRQYKSDLTGSIIIRPEIARTYGAQKYFSSDFDICFVYKEVV
jgi:hypothetical protein